MGIGVAAKLLIEDRWAVSTTPAKPAGASGPVLKPMNRESQARFVAVLLFLLTVAAVVFAGFNFQKERDSAVPDDGVWWVERAGDLVADRVDPSGPGAKAGIKAGDQVIAVNGQEIKSTPGLVRQLYRTGVWSKATYTLVRQSVTLDSNVILVPADRSLNNWLRLIALIYLGIGVYVLLRRWTAPGSTHFYIFCLVSFIAYSFKYTGKLNDFDWTIYWSNIVAWVLQPALFLHFVLTFPEKREFVRRQPWLLALAYLPGAILLGRHIIALRLAQATGHLRWDMDRQEMAYGALLFVAAAAVLWQSYRVASTTILRQQLKWVTRGTVLAIVPYTLFYVVPYLMGSLPDEWMKLSVLFLGLLPLTFGFVIFRYRLMDVDVISKRVVVYTLAAAAVVGLYFGMVAGIATLVHMRQPGSGPVGLIIAMVVTALLFDPVRKWIQERVDHLFYRTVYDYRRTLLEFGRELGSETDLNALLSSVLDRLSRTLAVDRIAIFLRTGDDAEQFVISKSMGMNPTGKIDLTFLGATRPEPAGHMFFENTHQVPRETPSGQDAIARLDLNYYIPCRAQQKTVSVLGLGKTTNGDYLSSEDIELLETLGGYLGIAIQNGRLYASLQQKVAEYERLKDFNENIVESINVGVMALDMEDRIESWNAQMEVMYAMPRWQTLTQPVRSDFPRRIRGRVLPGAAKRRHQQPLQIPPADSRRRDAHRQRGHCAAGDAQVPGDRPPGHHGRHYRARRSGRPAFAGGQALVHRPAGCRRGPRSEYAAGRDFFLHANAGQATAGRSAKVGIAGKDHAADLPRVGDRQQPAELLAHQWHRVHRCRRQQSHHRHARAARASVQDGQNSSCTPS